MQSEYYSVLYMIIKVPIKPMKIQKDFDDIVFPRRHNILFISANKRDTKHNIAANRGHQMSQTLFGPSTSNIFF